ncbi:unnamed protein product [Closterium sp. NIES-64]|nr:unnamed protein product [Closterium sp. NIES-64]
MRGDNEAVGSFSGHQAGTDGLVLVMEMRLRALEGQLEETRRGLEEAERRRAEEIFGPPVMLMPFHFLPFPSSPFPFSPFPSLALPLPRPFPPSPFPSLALSLSRPSPPSPFPSLVLFPPHPSPPSPAPLSPANLKLQWGMRVGAVGWERADGRLLSRRSSDGTSVLPSQHGREMAALAGTEGSRGMRTGSRQAMWGRGRARTLQRGRGQGGSASMAAAGAGSAVMRSDGNRPLQSRSLHVRLLGCPACRPVQRMPGGGREWV